MKIERLSKAIRLKTIFRQDCTSLKLQPFIDFKALPENSYPAVCQTLEKQVINNDAIKIEICDGIISEPSPVSNIKSEGFLSVRKAIRRIFPDIAISPGLVTGTTDSRYYTEISRNNYRFAPFVFGPEDRLIIHGTNERVSLEGYIRAIKFYRQLIKNSA